MDDLFMILGFSLLFVGLPTSIITTIIFAVKKKKIKVPAICIPVSLVLSLIFLVIGADLYSKTDEYKENETQKRIEKEQEESKKNLQGRRKTRKKNKKKERIKQEQKEAQKETEKQKEKEEKEKKKAEEEQIKKENPFPDTEKYIVNNTLLKYNEIAEFPIDNVFIEDIKKIGRPLSKSPITISNGVYFIIRYNDYSRILFIDYQEETNDNSGLYAVLRDMIKSVNPEIQDDEIQAMWEELETNKYSNYYGDKYEIGGFGINFSSNKLNNGQIRYSIKTEYSLK